MSGQRVQEEEYVCSRDLYVIKAFRSLNLHGPLASGSARASIVAISVTQEYACNMFSKRGSLVSRRRVY